MDTVLADGIPVYCSYTKLVPTDNLVPNPRNPNTHPDNQLSLLAKIIKAQGWRAPITVSERSGFVVRGHGRLLAAQLLGVSEVPIDTQQYDSEAAEWADLVADNRIAELASMDTSALRDVLEELDTSEFDMDLTGFDHVEVERVMTAAVMERHEEEAAKEREPSPRNLLVDGVVQVPPRDASLDAVYTLTPNSDTFWIARAAGLLVGVQTSKSMKNAIAKWTPELPVKLSFIDNDYHDYDHALHLSMVAEHRPKYCTVRDYMTKAQCRDAGIEYYTLDTILGWADELSEHAENVMIIPKYDVIDEIPDKFMLGYSVPTSYGGTQIPTERFAGRRIHLLGGSWRAQRMYLNMLGEDVVSLDFNQAYLIATFGQVVMPEGGAKQLEDFNIRMGTISNPASVAFAISVGHIGKEIHRITRGRQGGSPDIEEELSDIADFRFIDTKDAGDYTRR